MIAEQVILDDSLKQEDYFAGQREILARIIHSVPTCAFEAQTVLDQILYLITALCDERGE